MGILLFEDPLVNRTPLSEMSVHQKAIAAKLLPTLVDRILGDQQSRLDAVESALEALAEVPFLNVDLGNKGQ